MKRFAVLILFVLVASGMAYSQHESSLHLQIVPHYQHHKLSLQDTIFQLAIDDISIETLRFYVSHFTLYDAGVAVWRETSGFHLIDATDSTSYQFDLNHEAVNFDEIGFLLGIDSTTSTSGVFGGDLDPTNGMYWAWNSGYINFKIEGKSSRCTTRDKMYQFHLGGYAAPFANAHAVRLLINQNEEINIALDVSNFLDQVDLSKQHSIMSPSARAVEFSKIISESFYIYE